MHLNSEVKQKTKIRKMPGKNKSTIELFMLQLPAIVYVLLFSYLPMIGIIVAFKQYRFNLGIFGSPWNGLKNFEFLFGSDTFTTLLRNTIGYNLLFLVVGNIVNVTLAIFMYNIKSKYSLKVVQSAIFIPHFLSWIVVSYVSFALLSYDLGFLNKIADLFGLEKQQYYFQPQKWPLIFLLFTIWKGSGFGTLVYYGTILAIDTELFEAAAIDGCGYIKRIWYIILPHLKVTAATLMILSLGNIMHSDFGMYFYLPMDEGALYKTTDVIDTYIMRSIRETNNLSASSAASFLQSVVGCALVVTVNAIVRKFDKESALF